MNMRRWVLVTVAVALVAVGCAQRTPTSEEAFSPCGKSEHVTKAAVAMPLAAVNMSATYLYAGESDGIEYWRVGSDGKLDAVGGPGNNKIVTAGTPKDLALSADCKTLYSANGDMVEYWGIDSQTGASAAIGGPGNNRSVSKTNAIVAHPSAAALFGNNEGDADVSGVLSWKVGDDGALLESEGPSGPLRTWPNPAAPAVGKLAVAPDGNRLYGALKESRRIYSYHVDSPMKYWGVDATGTETHVREIGNRTLNPDEAGTPAEFWSVALAVSPNSSFLYSGARTADAGAIEYWAANQDGSLSAIGGAGNNRIFTGTEVWDIAISPDGKYLYAGEWGTIARWTIEPDGALRDQTRYEVQTGEDPFTIAISPDGKYLYAGENDQIEFWSIDANSGALTAVGGPGNNKVKTGLGAVKTLAIG